MAGALILGLLLIVMNDPPRSICDTHVELFKKEFEGQLYPKKIKGTTLKPKINKFIAQCKLSNNSGGCAQLFSFLRDLVKSLKKVSGECKSEFASDPMVNGTLYQSFDLMIRIAWGSEPPRTYLDKNNWFGPSHLALFCQLKFVIEDFYGKKFLQNYREKMFRELPGIAKLTRQEGWSRMLLSTQCNRYK